MPQLNFFWFPSVKFVPEEHTIVLALYRCPLQKKSNHLCITRNIAGIVYRFSYRLVEEKFYDHITKQTQ